jgi:hypothetical protein
MRREDKLKKRYVKIPEIYTERCAKEMLCIAKRLLEDFRTLPPRFDTNSIRVELYSYGNMTTNDFETIEQALELFTTYLDVLVKNKKLGKKKRG